MPRKRMYPISSQCEHCGQEFTKKNKRTRFCSKKCAGKAKTIAEPYETKPCVGCGEPIRVKTRGKGSTPNRKYCSLECYHASKDAKQETTCEHCGKTFAAYKSYLKRGQFRYCSDACRIKGRGYGVPKEDLIRTCAVCGTKFNVSVTDHLAGKNRKHCSKECQRRRLVKECAWCGIEYEVLESRASESQYCSRPCYMKGRASTRIEKLIAAILTDYEVEFITEYKIDSFSVDFVCPDLMLAIEADGDYWHSQKEREPAQQRKDRAIADYGLTLVRMPENRLGQDAERELLKSILKALAVAMKSHPWSS